ncbi:hypothetical protein P4V43_09175 [Brevibacillus fortis]|uniref:hypothetical protein n=1 Tax=Brevibacillus fortis TaxID=2126352 RepID=UPI002E20B210|nr:hypothetical protein [Brevibacillus fortis]
MKPVVKIVTASVLSSLLLFNPLTSKVSFAKDSFEVNILNASSFEIREDFVNEKLKNVTADIQEIKKASLIDDELTLDSEGMAPTVLIMDHKKDVDLDSLIDKYDLIMKIEKVDSKEVDYKIYWFGKNKHDAIIKGTDKIFVDVNGYKNRDNVNREEVIESKIVAVTKEHLKFIEKSEELPEDDELRALADYGWKTVDSDQISELAPPYGDLYMNFKARKAIDAGNYYAIANITAHIVPGAFLLAEENDNDYEDFETKNAEIKIKGIDKNGKSSAVKFLEHKPTNQGNSGSKSYSIGGGAGGLTSGITWEQDWDDLDMEDKSSTYGRWFWDFSGAIEEQVAEVTGGATFRFTNDTEAEIDFEAEVYWTDGWVNDPRDSSFLSDYLEFDF